MIASSPQRLGFGARRAGEAEYIPRPPGRLREQGRDELPVCLAEVIAEQPEVPRRTSVTA